MVGDLWCTRAEAVAGRSAKPGARTLFDCQIVWACGQQVRHHAAVTTPNKWRLKQRCGRLAAAASAQPVVSARAGATAGGSVRLNRQAHCRRNGGRADCCQQSDI